MEENMLSELTANCNNYREQITVLLEQFDLATLGYEVEMTHEKDVYNKVLNENEFFAAHDCERAGIKIGDRITDETFDFLLSDDEFERYMDICHKPMAEAGITDDYGNYLINWIEILNDARNELFDFIVNNIVPVCLRKGFTAESRNVITEEKLIGIVRKCLK